MNKPEYEAWVMQTKTLLDQSVQELDATTLSRLNRARQAALAQRFERRLYTWLLPAGLTSACAVILALAVWYPRALPPVSAPSISAVAIDTHTLDGNDADWVSGDDALEFYQDLDFYVWLDAQDEDMDG